MRKKNMALLLEYDGSRYDGWQRQGNTDNTIEGKLEKILERLTGACQQVHGSGRTDAGVHAAGQVANVCLDTDMSEGELRDYLNRYLPEDIKVLQVREVPERFHSRLWAKEKTYTYYIDMDEKSSVFARKYTYAVGKGLDVGAMEQAVGYLVGTHDFAGFCSNKKKKKSTVRTIKDIRFQVSKNCLSVSVTGDGFLYNMVRILVGTLIEIGLGKRTPDSVKAVLDSRDRQTAGFMAPARGLFLVSVVYETEIFPVEVEGTVR
ncbi:MAG: tRNA pseudouridine(38-40) synthase TruA [Hungatella sp.]|jgi:tRNA pseudouridine38-40 synthase|nr:tRNA pseudouridine(38-40) synthase TruA [Hungatella sp.]